MKNMPQGFNPQSNAWTAVFPEGMTDLVFAQFGVQSGDAEKGRELFQQIFQSFRLPNGPRHLDRATSTDAQAGVVNQVWLAYWESPAQYEAWLANTEVQSWFNGVNAAQHAEVGFWREVLTIPTTHFESLHSGENYDNGVSHFLNIEYTKVHEYWGGMRDRMKASEADDFISPFGAQLPERLTRETFGKNIRITAPDYIAFIRTAQNWTKCNGDERVTYTEEVHPTLVAAHDFFRANPVEAGCISSHLLYEQTHDGTAEDKTCVAAYFLSLGHLEEWAKSHPTHLEIFRVFFKMLRQYSFKTDLALWHEVSVLKSKDMDLFYSNCQPLTGFLPYFEAVEC